jgi:hypothetical protein
MSEHHDRARPAGGAHRGHRVAWVAAGLRRAAASQGIELPVDYARQVAQDGLGLGDEVLVTRLGSGVVIRSAPRSERELSVLLGYAESSAQWYRDGRRHVGPTHQAGPEAPAETLAP